MSCSLRIAISRRKNGWPMIAAVLVEPGKDDANLRDLMLDGHRLIDRVRGQQIGVVTQFSRN